MDWRRAQVIEAGDGAFAGENPASGSEPKLQNKQSRSSGVCFLGTHGAEEVPLQVGRPTHLKIVGHQIAQTCRVIYVYRYDSETGPQRVNAMASLLEGVADVVRQLATCVGIG